MDSSTPPIPVPGSLESWQRDVVRQQRAAAGCMRTGDRLGEARARCALGALCLRNGLRSSAAREFRDSLRILVALEDSEARRWCPPARRHLSGAIAAGRLLLFLTGAQDSR